MTFDLGSFMTNLFTGPGTPLDALFGTGGSPGLFSNPSGAWDQFKNGRTNEVNKEIADENLGYQKDVLEYQKALQQQIFEREDTSYQRTAADMAAAGINPLMMKQTNGAGAEVPVTAPHNDFQMQDKGVFEALSPLLGLANTINGVQTGEYQRDSLALQNDKQFLDNLEKANGLGIQYRGYLPYETGGKNYRENVYNFTDTKTGDSLFSNDLFKGSMGSTYRKNRKDSMPDWQFTLDQLGNNDVYESAERALTKGSQLFDKTFDNLFDKENGNSIYDLGKGKNGKFNPFNLLLNLFY